MDEKSRLLLLEDLKLIAELDLNTDYKSADSINDTLKKITENGYFSTVFGSRYKLRLQSILNKSNSENTCVICGKEADNNRPLCSACANAIIKGKSKTQSEEENKINAVSNNNIKPLNTQPLRYTPEQNQNFQQSTRVERPSTDASTKKTNATNIKSKKQRVHKAKGKSAKKRIALILSFSIIAVAVAMVSVMVVRRRVIIEPKKTYFAPKRVLIHFNGRTTTWSEFDYAENGKRMFQTVYPSGEFAGEEPLVIEYDSTYKVQSIQGFRGKNSEITFDNDQYPSALSVEVDGKTYRIRANTSKRSETKEINLGDQYIIELQSIGGVVRQEYHYVYGEHDYRFTNNGIESDWYHTLDTEKIYDSNGILITKNEMNSSGNKVIGHYEYDSLGRITLDESYYDDVVNARYTWSYYNDRDEIKQHTRYYGGNILDSEDESYSEAKTTFMFEENDIIRGIEESDSKYRFHDNDEYTYSEDYSETIYKCSYDLEGRIEEVMSMSYDAKHWRDGELIVPQNDQSQDEDDGYGWETDRWIYDSDGNWIEYSLFDVSEEWTVEVQYTQTTFPYTANECDKITFGLTALDLIDNDFFIGFSLDFPFESFWIGVDLYEGYEFDITVDNLWCASPYCPITERLVEWH